MKCRKLVLLVLLGCAAGAAAGASAAPVTPLAALDGDAQAGPVLADGQVAWGSRRGRTVTVWSRPLAGGAERVIGSARVGRDALWSVEGFTGAGVAFTPGDTEMEEQSSVLAGPATGPLRRVTVLQLVGGLTTVGPIPTPAGLLTQTSDPGTRDEVLLFDPAGTYRVVALPAQLDTTLEPVVAGRFLVAPRRRGDALVVLDLVTGRVQREVTLGAAGGRAPYGFAAGTDGSVAAVIPKGDSDELVHAGPSATTATAIRPDVLSDRIAVDGTRIALAGTLGRRARVEVLDVRDPSRSLSRGPVAGDVDDLRLGDGAVAYRVPGCAVVGPADGGDAGRLLPPGPCVRSQVTTALARTTRHGGRIGAQSRVRCLAAPAAACRVRVTFEVTGHPTHARWRRVGQVAARIPVGRSRTLRVLARGRAAGALRAEVNDLRTATRVTDPGGATRVQHD